MQENDILPEEDSITIKEGLISYLAGWLVASVFVIFTTYGVYLVETPLEYCEYKFCIKGVK